MAANVWIVPLPYGKGDVRQPNRPYLSYSLEAEEVPCRPQRPDLRDIQNIKGLRVISKLLQARQGIEQNQSENQGTRRSEPVNVSVQGGWIKLGFFIDNKNTGPGRNFTLKIDRLEIYGNGNCEQEGQPPCPYRKTIPTGYCGLPFLYLVRPGTSIEYQTLSPNPLWNLSIYVDNIPVIDASQLPQRQNRLPGGATLILPQYKMEVLFIGEFLLEDGQTFRPFRKRVNFTTNSRQAF